MTACAGVSELGNAHERLVARNSWRGPDRDEVSRLNHAPVRSVNLAPGARASML
jgi:hypothetical protein